MVLTDSNGRGVTPDIIGDFLGGEEREKWEIQVVQAFTLREAWVRLRRGDIGVEGARVVVDCVTNDVQGRVEPGEVAERLRRVIGEMRGAEKVVVCEVKPMRHINVVPFNARIHGLLDTEGVKGCRMQHLGPGVGWVPHRPPLRAGYGFAVWMRHSRVAGPRPLLGMSRERVAATGGKRGKREAEGPRLEGTIAPLWREW